MSCADNTQFNEGFNRRADLCDAKGFQLQP